MVFVHLLHRDTVNRELGEGSRLCSINQNHLRAVGSRCFIFFVPAVKNIQFALFGGRSLLYFVSLKTTGSMHSLADTGFFIVNAFDKAQHQNNSTSCTRAYIASEKSKPIHEFVIYKLALSASG